MRGVVWDGSRLHVTDALEVRAPGPGEARVKVLRSGICHSDLNMMESDFTATPIVLGHEAAGVIAEVGPGVTGWLAGEAVMVGTQTPCGQCRECQRGTPANCDVTWGFGAARPFMWKGQPTASFANISSFAEEIVVKAEQLFRSDGLPPEQAALIGCAVSTGCCAATNLGRVKAGDRVVVIGVGGIGVNAIQAAALAGATVLAVDIHPAKEVVARHFGAQFFLQAVRDQDGAALAKAMRAAFSPIDLSIECSGAPAAIDAAIHGLKRGGRAVLIGIGRQGAEIRLNLDAMLGGREIISEYNGGARPARDYPQLIALARERKIDIAGQISGIWPLAEVEDAIAALRAGKVTRALLDHTA